ncbi:hypothetical protein CEXT_637451 [Caerostris extrusa]|uniref:Uncharacterized protein n=1 Tax=Caerostris extrusa TaxID=172846 RepID=A0AAV4NDS1_CAEEX|nr:hypothetical protein CEXT_637451 [Caerostris extrusa]
MRMWHMGEMPSAISASCHKHGKPAEAGGTRSNTTRQKENFLGKKKKRNSSSPRFPLFLLFSGQNPSAGVRLRAVTKYDDGGETRRTSLFHFGLNGGANEDGHPLPGGMREMMIRAGDDEQGVYRRTRSMPASDSLIIRARSNKPFFSLKFDRLWPGKLLAAAQLSQLKRQHVFENAFDFAMQI